MRIGSPPVRTIPGTQGPKWRLAAPAGSQSRRSPAPL